jgi:hypothetical protein
MMRSRSISGRRGGALLELALFAPVLLYLLVAVGDFGRYFVESSRLDDVARAAAHRAALAEPNETDATVRVETFCACPQESPEPFACGVRSCGGGYGEPARYVQATAEQPFSFISRYPGFPSSFTMRSQAGVRVR